MAASSTRTSPRTGTARTARSQRTRAALVSAVRAELRERGGFTADQVAGRAGCSPATFYSHFGAKDDALTAAFEQVLADLVEQSASLLSFDEVRNGLDTAVARFVDRQAAFFGREAFVFRTALARLPDHRPLRDAYRAAETVTLTRLKKLITDAQQRGYMRAGAPAAMAEALLVLSQGINNPRVIRPGAAATRAEMALAIVALLAPAGSDAAG